LHSNLIRFYEKLEKTISDIWHLTAGDGHRTMDTEWWGKSAVPSAQRTKHPKGPRPALVGLYYFVVYVHSLYPARLTHFVDIPYIKNR